MNYAAHGFSMDSQRIPKHDIELGWHSSLESACACAMKKLKADDIFCDVVIRKGIRRWMVIPSGGKVEQLEFEW